MNGLIERVLFISVIVGLGVMLVKEGQTQVQLESQIPVGAQQLYDQMAKGKSLQVIDIRPLDDDDNDDVGGYRYARVPKSIPFPGCVEDGTPAEALKNIKRGVPTVIVSLDGDTKALEACKMFPRARILSGGMLAWDEEGLPVEEGEYVAPKMGGGGGCL